MAAARSLGLPFVALTDLVAPGAADSPADSFEIGEEVELRQEAGRLVIEAVKALAEARRRGLVAIDGREVLLYQAIPQFRSMTGRELPLPLARQVLGLAAEEA